MKLQTKYFGPVECERADILEFPEGLFAFEEERQFVLLPFQGSDGAMLCLQSVTTPALAFVVMDPYSLKPDYAPHLSSEEQKLLGAGDDSALYVYTLCAVKRPVSQSTVNLRCPIVINSDTSRAMQVILDTDTYHMRHPLDEFASGKGDDGPC